MTDELKIFLTANKNALMRNDFEKIFKDINSRQLRVEFIEFLYNQVNINPLMHMSVIPANFFRSVNLKSELFIPSNIKTVEREALCGFKAAGLKFDGGNISFVSDSVSYFDAKYVYVGEGVVNLPKNFCKGCSMLEKAFIPSTVKRLKEGCFRDCNQNIRIITPYRDNTSDRLVITKEDIPFYKEHLRFTHAPKEVNQEVENEIQAQ